MVSADCDFTGGSPIHALSQALIELLAVGQNDGANRQEIRSTLVFVPGHGDVVARLQTVLAPSNGVQRGGGSEFGGPVFRFSVGHFDGQMEHAMRIDVLEAGYDSLDRGDVLQVVQLGLMMGPRKAGESQQKQQTECGGAC